MQKKWEQQWVMRKILKELEHENMKKMDTEKSKKLIYYKK